MLLRLQYSANRAKWISSTECALYVHTEQQHWTSHHEVPLFLSRPLYLIWECKRILSSNKAIITRANTATHFSHITYEFQPTATAGDTQPAAEETHIEERCSGDAPPEPCNDSNASRIEEVDTSEAEAGGSDSEGNDEGMDDQDTYAEEYQVQATECRATSSRHDDWLHRGPFLADLPLMHTSGG